MDIGPNLTSIILQLITAAVAVVTGVLAYLANRRTKAIDVKVDAVDAKVVAVADGMRTALDAAQAKASVGVGKAAQVEVERVGERERAAERVLQAGDAGRELGRAEGKAESGLMPLDPLGPPP